MKITKVLVCYRCPLCKGSGGDGTIPTRCRRCKGHGDIEGWATVNYFIKQVRLEEGLEDED